MFIANILDICEPVLTFDRIIKEIGVEKYLQEGPNGGEQKWTSGASVYTILNPMIT